MAHVWLEETMLYIEDIKLNIFGAWDVCVGRILNKAAQSMSFGHGWKRE